MSNVRIPAPSDRDSTVHGGDKTSLSAGDLKYTMRLSHNFSGKFAFVLADEIFSSEINDKNLEMEKNM